jgi:nucleotide-binding universal stress UspA family protein
LKQNWERFNIIAPETLVAKPDEVIKKIEEKLKEIGEKVRKNYGVKATGSIVYGNVTNEIVTAATKQKADLVIMGKHGVSGFQEFFAGSNTFKVASHAPCPVISVQTHNKKPGLRNILLPIDNTSTSKLKVKHAMEIASHYGAKVHILGLIGDKSKADVKEFDAGLEEIEEYFSKHDVPAEIHKVKGKDSTADTIKIAKKVDAGLIIIMTGKKENNLSGFFIAPLAQQVINQSKIPVMSIRPEVIPWAD